MKSTSMVVVVVAVVLVASVGYIVYTDPSLFSGGKSTPPTLNGLNIVSTGTVNTSMGGHWSEVFAVNGGIGNISQLYKGYPYLFTGPLEMLVNNTTAQVSSLQLAGFQSTTNNSALLFGYLGLSSVKLADMINGSVFKNISMINGQPGYYAVKGTTTNGALYAYVSYHYGQSYESVVYAIYKQSLMYGVYNGSSNLSLSHFTDLLTNQVNVLNSYNTSFKASEKLIQASTINNNLSNSGWVSVFNASITLFKASGLINSSLNSTGYSMVTNEAGNFTSNISSMGFSLFTNKSDAGLELGYVGMTSTAAANETFKNASLILGELRGQAPTYGNTTSGVKLEYANATAYSSGNETDLTIALYGSYIIEVEYVGVQLSQTSLLGVMQAEASLL
ncbi:MAG: hypothetical protein QW597_04900 [Thermoplasmataceae archaeon]